MTGNVNILSFTPPRFPSYSLTVTLEEFRREKDSFFASSRSPLPAATRSGFTGLRYYPSEPALRCQIPLEVDAARESLVMSTSTGDERVYERLGWVNFEVDGASCRLALYTPEGDLEPEAAFVPFRDATSGSETYGSGRYLEAELHGGTVTLDFNLAYNPYCAYGEGWSCPIPPRENWLTVPIRAGEQNLELEASA
jgi:uncharacterized protein